MEAASSIKYYLFWVFCDLISTLEFTMALSPCRNCGKDISESQDECIECGDKNPHAVPTPSPSPEPQPESEPKTPPPEATPSPPMS